MDEADSIVPAETGHRVVTQHDASGSNSRSAARSVSSLEADAPVEIQPVAFELQPHELDIEQIVLDKQDSNVFPVRFPWHGLPPVIDGYSPSQYPVES